MRIGIIGPNKLFEGDLEKKRKLLEEVAKIIAKSGNEILLTPDKDSLLEYFGKKYLEFNGNKISIIAPMDDSPEKYLNLKIGKIINCSSWDKQANEFNRKSDLILCIGWAWGALKEVACVQYENKKKVYVLKEFISEELPKELNFLIDYISIKELEDLVPITN